MLHEFLIANREQLIERCRKKVATRDSPRPTEPELMHGIPLFLDQLIKILSVEEATLAAKSRNPAVAPTEGRTVSNEIGTTAATHGSDLLLKGFTVNQVVHDYGDLCQAVTELAAEKKAPITVEEFRTFNGCLDDAIAGAVTEFGRVRDQRISAAGTIATNERLGELVHELGNLLTSAMLAFRAIKTGNVAVKGATGAVLDRSLIGMRNLIARSLAEVRLTAGLEARRELISIGDLVEEVEVAAAMEAQARGVVFTVSPVDAGLAVYADRQLLNSAVSNVLQNAFKFTRSHGHASLSVRFDAWRVFIDVEDECGGLPAGKAEELFQPFEQRSGDRSGVGLGLPISKRSVEANGGTLRVVNLPGKGCVFTIDLPRAQNPAPGSHPQGPIFPR